DVRCTRVGFVAAGLAALPSGIGPLLGLQLLDDLVEGFEAGAPELAVTLDPGGLLLERTCAEPAGADTSGFRGRDEPGALEHAHVLPHSRERHLKLPGQLGDRRLGAPEPLQHPAPGRIRQCRECGIEAGLLMLNHLVQYTAARAAVEGEALLAS